MVEGPDWSEGIGGREANEDLVAGLGVERQEKRRLQDWLPACGVMSASGGLDGWVAGFVINDP